MLLAQAPILDKYTLRERLAIGGMGEVFYATSPGHPEGVAIKRLLPELAREEGYVGRFIDEARVQAAMRHPNIVKTLELARWQGTYVLVMEYVHGRDVSSIVREAARKRLRVPEHVALAIICDTAEALDHAHAAAQRGEPLNVVHRDISPENLIVSIDTGLTKLIDFGLAGEERDRSGSSRGKLHYLTPEQAAGQPLTPATDQYALGLVFWELLTGRRAYAGEAEVVLPLVREGTVPPPEPAVSPAVERVLMRMLAPSPALRYRSCGEVAQELRPMVPPSAREDVRAFVMKLGTKELDDRVAGVGATITGTTPPAGLRLRAMQAQAAAIKPPTNEHVVSRLLIEYLEGLSVGLESQPELKQKAALFLALLKDLKVPEAALVGLPHPVVNLCIRPPLGGMWVPLVHASAATLIVAEHCYASTEAFIASAHERFRRLFETPVYAMFFQASNWKQLLAALPPCWEQLERGSGLRVVSSKEGEAQLLVALPDEVLHPVLAQCHGARLRAQLELGGLSKVSVEQTASSDQGVLLTARWAP